MTARASPSGGPMHHRTMSAGVSSPLFPVSSFEQAAAAVNSAPQPTPQLKSFPMTGESALGGALRLEAPIVAQTVRCYQVYKVDVGSLHHVATGGATTLSSGGSSSTTSAAAGATNSNGTSSPAQSPVAASSPKFPQDQTLPGGESLGVTCSATSSLHESCKQRSTLSSVSDNLWRIATLTDLLLLAVCVLINVPTLAKLITSVVATSEGSSSISASAIVSLSSASAPWLSSNDSQQHDFFSMERIAALISYLAAATPFRTITALDGVGVWLRTNIDIRIICAMFGIDEYTAWRRLADMWRGTLAPVLSSPPIFWTIVLVALVCLRMCLRARHVFMQRVVVVSGVGMQLTTYNYLGRVVQQRFLDVNRIHSVVIHEAFLRQRVVFYLAVLLDNEAEVTVLFDEMVPRLALLRPLLCGIRSVLYQESEDGATLGELEDSANNANVSGMLPT
ncbi:membrane-associated protein, putative [Bodo saltans]|uniref:Membrane-associated protein, putative n=1 Tax=Bodo saltans TaxID=75058 RepID=A0A0S4IUX2_BODSA|nr:membrane-associated protein, putative [Bodo saltans]|eukprot:CUG00426.1 membrane-associated protein, putative [Bodo saltans]